MTEQAALCGTTNGVIPLSSHLPQEERWCDVCVCVFVRVSSYANMRVVLGRVRF